MVGLSYLSLQRYTTQGVPKKESQLEYFVENLHTYLAAQDTRCVVVADNCFCSKWKKDYRRFLTLPKRFSEEIILTIYSEKAWKPDKIKRINL